jgi:uncharacterized protein (TIGR00297 family)
MLDILIGLLGSFLIAGLAYKKGSLSGSGFLAAIAIGTLLYAVGSLAWFGTLILFFISSSLLSRFKRRAKTQIETRYEKSGRRDAGQVLANGGLGVLLCIGAQVWPHPAWWAAFVGVMATVNADTWATEIGGLSRTAPRSILTLQPVTPGTSGGVSGLGIAATMAGGLFVGAIAALLLLVGSTADGLPTGSVTNIFPLLVIGWIAGTAGSLADSLLGARWQNLNRCPVCGEEVESRTHCGTASVPHRGWRWLNNDAVNLIASVIGGLVAVLLAVIWS